MKKQLSFEENSPNICSFFQFSPNRDPKHTPLPIYSDEKTTTKKIIY